MLYVNYLMYECLYTRCHYTWRPRLGHTIHNGELAMDNVNDQNLIFQSDSIDH